MNLADLPGRYRDLLHHATLADDPAAVLSDGLDPFEPLEIATVQHAIRTAIAAAALIEKRHGPNWTPWIELRILDMHDDLAELCHKGLDMLADAHRSAAVIAPDIDGTPMVATVVFTVLTLCCVAELGGDPAVDLICDHARHLEHKPLLIELALDHLHPGQPCPCGSTLTAANCHLHPAAQTNTTRDIEVLKHLSGAVEAGGIGRLDHLPDIPFLMIPKGASPRLEELLERHLDPTQPAEYDITWTAIAADPPLVTVTITWRKPVNLTVRIVTSVDHDLGEQLADATHSFGLYIADPDQPDTFHPNQAVLLPVGNIALADIVNQARAHAAN